MFSFEIQNPILLLLFFYILVNGILLTLVEVLGALSCCAVWVDRYFKYRTEDVIREAVWEHELPRHAAKIKAGAK